MLDESEQMQQRREKLKQLRTSGVPFPNDFRRDAFAGDLADRYADAPEKLAQDTVRVKVAGRLISRRVMGKASFAHIRDMTGQIQLFVQRDRLPEGVYNEQFKKFDIGDIICAEGELFHTKTGELSIRTDTVRLLTKSLRPLPEKYHGLIDPEIRYRQRYVDLIVNESTRQVFRTRAAIIQYIRSFMIERLFLEVETPMMHPIPGGALARPFATYHNALDMPLFLRVAPELYLKRLVVGGFERVFEINRSFRNEGISTRHNPEFTMLEFYWAYADYQDLIDLTEKLVRGLFQTVLGTQKISYQGQEIDFSKPFKRWTLLESIVHFCSDIEIRDLTDLTRARALCDRLDIPVQRGDGLGKLQMELFEKQVEDKLVDPVFITAYPVEVSPLSRRNDAEQDLSDRFELFAGRRELANGFSELNDPEDQADRFKKQVKDKEAGDVEAMHYDADYIRALEYGMPPTAGEGIGIDRLVMLMTDSPSIRDVLLFPHMRPETTPEP